MSIEGLILTSPAVALAKLIAAKVSGTSVEAPASDDMAVTRLETERQENEMRRLEAQAKVAQETAIASRIATAVEVTIEEYFEYAGEGKAGLSADGGTLNLGLAASGKRVSKRVIRFNGHRATLGDTEETELSSAAIEQTL